MLRCETQPYFAYFELVSTLTVDSLSQSALLHMSPSVSIVLSPNSSFWESVRRGSVCCDGGGLQEARATAVPPHVSENDTRMVASRKADMWIDTHVLLS